MNLLVLAARNIVRYRHRTLVTTLAMAFAGAIMILFSTLMVGLLQASERNAVVMNLGDVQVHAQGYREDPDLYNVIRDPEDIVQKIHGSAQESGVRASYRLYGFGLAASGRASSGIQLRAIVPALEAQVTQLHKHVAQGQWLSPEDDYGVVIGRRLAKTLGIGPGDELVFLGQASDGSIANDVFRVRGVLKSVAEGVDRSGVYLLMSTFRQLMAMPQGAHEIAAIRLDRTTPLAAIKQSVLDSAPGYEVMDWKELRPVLANILESAGDQMLFMLIITYTAVATVVLNAMLMSVFERIHEFGVMKALGVTPWQLIRLIYAETFLQVLIASLLALAGGWALSQYFHDNAIDLSQIASGASFAGVAMDPLWRTELTAESFYIPIILQVVIALLAVLYPAIKAAVIQPVKAIYYR
ncbi:MAG: ABC transporter permease [Gammaproteobacteria bacterium]|nr:MAG: ABC transporter permease [Gammaproteobacteria bacterium]